MHRPQDVAARLGISPVTLRAWSVRFANALSPSARRSTSDGGSALQRRYSDTDIALLERIKALLDSGRTYRQVETDLGHPSPPAPMLADHPPQLRPDAAAVALVELVAAKNETIAAQRETIAALRAEVERLRADQQRQRQRYLAIIRQLLDRRRP